MYSSTGKLIYYPSYWLNKESAITTSAFRAAKGKKKADLRTKMLGLRARVTQLLKEFEARKEEPAVILSFAE